jgi:N4-gp56 family major capsid protein
MGQTIIGVNDPKAVKKYSAFLAVDVARDSYFSRKFMGSEGSSMPIQVVKDLESTAGDKVSFDLSMQLSMQPVEGDTPLTGKEEDLKFYSDDILINQMRGGVNTGGRMTQKRTIHQLREIARVRQSEWWSRVFDELFFMYLSGLRGVNADYIFATNYTGFAGNAFNAPDSEHHLMPGIKTNLTIDANDKMTLGLIDKAVAMASMMGGGSAGTPKIQPIMINGERHFVCVMNPWQAYDLRQSSGGGGWLDIQKAAAAAEGRKNPIFQGGLGMYNNVVLHEHQAVIRFHAGAANPQTVDCARALFMGVQAAVIAFGSKGNGLRFGWYEEERDNGNQVVISTHSIFGISKVQFNAKDFGIMAIDTAAAQPVA